VLVHGARGGEEAGVGGELLRLDPGLGEQRHVVREHDGVRLPRDLVDVAARVRVEAQHVGAGALRHEGHEGVERVVLEEAAGVDETG
jgi:hypothetical protein